MGAKPPGMKGPSPRRTEDDGSRQVPAGASTNGARTSAGPVDPGSAGSSPGAGSAGAGSARGAGAPARPLWVWRERVRATLRIIRSNPTGRIALKVGVGVAGALVVAVGLALIPLPGPGWALVILGLAIWAIEFVWAKHLLRFTRTRVQQWTRWVKSRSWPVRVLLGLVGMVFIATVLVLSLRYSFGIDVIGDFWTYVTTH